jgi:MFS family permease
MSFRSFILYCGLYGGCAALVGWAFGKWVSVRDPVILTALIGLLVGLFLGLTLGMIDSLWNFSARRLGEMVLRMLVAAFVGCVAGFLGGMIGQIFFGWLRSPWFLVIGWTLTGLLIGASMGVFDVFARLFREEELRGAVRKVVNGVIGGGLGGLLGGLLFLLFRWIGQRTGSQDADLLWSPGATGFVALGICIGLLVGLAQVILKEAWIKVEAGFRPGRELMLEKDAMVIGRAEGSDVALFGDPLVEKTHARIDRRDGRFVLSDAATPGGTYLNGHRIDGPTPLRSGDLIGVGKCSLRFGERQKRGD